MPVRPCTKDDQPGYQWDAGVCHIYTPGDPVEEADALKKAERDGTARKRRREKRYKRRIND